MSKVILLFSTVLLLSCNHSKIKKTFSLTLIEYSLKDTISVPIEIDLRNQDTTFYTSYLISYKFKTNLPKGTLLTFKHNWSYYIESASWFKELDLSYQYELNIESDTVVTPFKLLLINGGDNRHSMVNIFVLKSKQRQIIKNHFRHLDCSSNFDTIFTTKYYPYGIKNLF